MLANSGLNDYMDNQLLPYNNKYRYVSESPIKSSPSNKFKKQFLLKNSGVLIPSSQNNINSYSAIGGVGGPISSTSIGIHAPPIGGSSTSVNAYTQGLAQVHQKMIKHQTKSNNPSFLKQSNGSVIIMKPSTKRGDSDITK